MGDLLQQGSQWLGAMLKEHASSPVTYRRADTELELQATFGRTEYEVEDEYGLRILDGLSIDLADGLNCLIGHRGTGKTTVLEFVRYALDEFQPGEAGQLCRRRVETLVKRSLGDGRIRLAIQTKDGLEYIVDRTASGDPLVLTADGEPTDITINSGGIFSADIFSQNEVEDIADSPESQLTLIDTFVAEDIGALEGAIVNKNRGYHLAAWLIMEDHDTGVEESDAGATQGHGPAMTPHDVANGPATEGTPGLSRGLRGKPGRARTL